jgi:hypothetical protein
MARPERFELPTYCSGGNRSIQLSYGRVAVNLFKIIICQSRGQKRPLPRGFPPKARPRLHQINLGRLSRDQQQRANSLKVAKLVGALEPLPEIIIRCRAAIGNPARFHPSESVLSEQVKVFGL